MKIESGNSYQNKIVGGIFKITFAMMEPEKKTRGAENKKKYRDKVKKVNGANAKFMAFAAEQAPGLWDDFLQKIK